MSWDGRSARYCRAEEASRSKPARNRFMRGCVARGLSCRNGMSRDFAPAKRYRVLRELGAGAQGRVYEAYDEERGARVAIKRLRDRSCLETFKREFRAAQGFRHPNVVTLGELVVEEDECFFT